MSRFDTLLAVLRLLRAEADRRVWTCLLCSVLLVVAGGALAALSPLALKHLVDAVAVIGKGAGAADGAHVLPYAAAYLLVLGSGRILADVRPLFGNRAEQRLQARLTQRFLDHVLRLPMAYLGRRRSGELQHSLDLADTGCQLILSHVANSLIPVLVEAATMGLVLMRLGQPMIVVIFAITAITYLAIFTAGALRLGAPADAVSSASMEVHAQLHDGVGNAETLRSFVAERQALRALARATTTLEERWLTLNRLNTRVALAASITFMVSMASCMTVAADAVAQGSLSVGGFVLANVYVLQMVRPLEVLGSAARDLSRALSYVGPLLNILAEPAESEEGAPAFTASTQGPQRGPPPALRFENVHFGYDPLRPVIRGLDLHVRAGCTTAIVGRSGCGKSSLVRLLMRLHSPQSGRILLDGRPIDMLSPARLRALIGLVPQDAALLHTSIAGNIALGRAQAGPDAVELAARHAQLHDVIQQMPHGYDTLVGERGLQLSGGERQRVAIARALLRRPALYVLDEPTSMLDSKTEAGILQALRKLTAGCTTLVIAHRLSTVMHADEIVVLDNGQVHERGQHAELLAKGGLYAQLWRQQTQGVALL